MLSGKLGKLGKKLGKAGKSWESWESWAGVKAKALYPSTLPCILA
jgi:hypothetical protein